MVIFRHSFLVSGVMCFEGCGLTLEHTIQEWIEDQKNKNTLPHDALLTLTSEPFDLGLHEVNVMITSCCDECRIDEHKSFEFLRQSLEDAIPFEMKYQDQDESATVLHHRWNLIINLLSLLMIILLFYMMPPSLALTLCLSVFTCIVTAWTSRSYLILFWQHVQMRQFFTMPISVSLGWLLSMFHLGFHVFHMPLILHFSMLSMNFMMPFILVACLNFMDEMKRMMMLDLSKHKLKGIKSLFPAMLDHYQVEDHTVSYGDLKPGMIFQVPTEACFPVDAILIDQEATVDTALLTGEMYHLKLQGETIPAGSINLGLPVQVRVLHDAYHSRMNTLLFRANRQVVRTPAPLSPYFGYGYAAVIALALTSAVVMPLSLGFATWTVIIHNVMAVLFSICPCTITMAYEMPFVMSLYARYQEGIAFHEGYALCQTETPIDTVVFDKTGTLTTGQAKVMFFDSTIDNKLWFYLYVLETQYGRAHPLAKAIQAYYRTEIHLDNMFPISELLSIDPLHRGFLSEIEGHRIGIGSVAYLRSLDIEVPSLTSSIAGTSIVCVSKDGIYQGRIEIEHEIRPDIQGVLQALKDQHKKIILLTGDRKEAASVFNARLGNLFLQEDIYADQTPQDKERFFTQRGDHLQGVWFVGDGLNDAPCCRWLSEKGGVSCAVTQQDKASFFADLILPGALDYLLKHHLLNQWTSSIIFQNKILLMVGAVLLFSAVVSFSMLGMMIPSLIPMGIMLLMTLGVLFNSQRLYRQTRHEISQKGLFSNYRTLSYNKSMIIDQIEGDHANQTCNT